jgi:membrane dipeptidase
MSEAMAPKLFDFGLDNAQEERARRLHQESIIIDMLFQGPVGSAVYTEEMVEQIKADFERHHDYWRNMIWAIGLPIRMAARGEFPEFKEWWDASGVTAGNRQLDTNSADGLLPTIARATLQFDRLDWLVKALSAEDIRRAKDEGKHAGFITAQNTVALGQDLDNLDMLHEFGLNMLQLSYNSMNFVAAGCTERTDAGVSSHGVKFIERMNELGIIVDTGHCGRQTTLDACEISKEPVVASHTCAQVVSGHARGKSDKELQALANTGGVVGVVTVPFFLSAEPGATVEHFLDHVDYTARLVGVEHVGIGTDWPMSLPDWGVQMLVEKIAPQIGFRPEDRMGVADLIGFEDYGEFVNITRGLVARGYSDEEISSILGGNWLRVMDQVWK